MHQGKQHGAHRRQPGPAVLYQQGVQGIQALEVGEGARGQVGHEHDGDDDLIRREAQDEGHEDHPVQAQQPGEGVQKPGAPVQDAHAPHLHVGAQPDEQARRGRHRHGPAQHEQGPVQHRPGDDLADLRLAVGRQLQREGGGHPLQDGTRQQPGDPEGHDHPQQDDPGEHDGGGQGLARPRPGAHEEHGDDGDQGGEPAVAGHEVVGDDGDEPLSGGVDDAAAHDARGVAPEPHTHVGGNLCYN